MQVLNPLLIVTLIPLFEATLYPCLRHYNLNFTPLQRMTVGQILAGVAFICAAIVQFAIEDHWTEIPDTHSEVSLRVINSAQCDIVVTTSNPLYESWQTTGVEGSTEYTGELVVTGNATNTTESWIDSTFANQDTIIYYQCLDDPSVQGEIEVYMEGETVLNVVVSDQGTNELKSNWYEGETLKSISGGGIITVFNALNYGIHVEICRGDGDNERCYEKYNVTSNMAGEEQDMDKDFYNVTAYDGDHMIFKHEYWLDTGAMYSLVIRDSVDYGDSMELGEVVGDFFEDIKPNHVNILWLIPQYFVITCGEVFLSVTGLEFSYTQAPPSMKAVLTSFWLLTVSFGNIIVLIIELFTWPDSQAYEYIFYAGLIFVAAFVFVLLALRYEYVDESVFAEEEEKKSIKSNSSDVQIKGKKNYSYDHDTEF